MKNSKETRTCIGCREKKEKQELFRIVASKNEGIILDLKQKKDGRGAYICKNKGCFEKAKKRKALSRALKTNVEDNKYNELRGVMFDRSR